MPGPEDETAAAEGRGRGRLRASRADREQAVELLKAAFVEDRLTKEELDTRVGQALTSRIYADLAAVTADIPAGLIAGEPREPVRVEGRPPMSKTAKAGISVAVAAAAPAVLSLVIGPLAFVMFAPFYVMGLLVAGAQILFTRYDKRSCKQPPPDSGRPADFPLTAGQFAFLRAGCGMRSSGWPRSSTAAGRHRKWLSAPLRRSATDSC